MKTYSIPQIEPLINLEVINRIQARNPISDAVEAARALGEIALIKPYEQAYAIYLDGSLRPIAIQQCGQGTPNRTPIDIQGVVASAILLCARGVAVAHTHPAGASTDKPSTADLETTKDLKEKLRWFGITLVDSLLLEHCCDGSDSVSVKSIFQWLDDYEENNEENKNIEPEAALV